MIGPVTGSTCVHCGPNSSESSFRTALCVRVYHARGSGLVNSFPPVVFCAYLTPCRHIAIAVVSIEHRSLYFSMLMRTP